MPQMPQVLSTNSDNAVPWAPLEREARVLLTPCGEGKMVWHLWGSGPPLVLLHGGAGSWLHWVRTIPAFAPEHLVIVPDLPGLGGTAPPPAGAGIREITAIVAEGLHEIIGADKACDLVGFSFGGVVAGYLAAQRINATRSLIFVGSGGLGVIRRSIPLERVRDKTGAEREDAHRINLHRWMIADPVRIDPLALAIQDWNSRHARFDSRPIGASDALLRPLRGMHVPVAGIWGALDHAVEAMPARAEAVLHGVSPDADFRIISDAGHWVAFEAAEAFNKTLRDLLFCRRASAARQPA